MVHTIQEFIEGWTYESASTQKLIDQFTDQSLATPIAEGHRTLGRIAWHIATSIPEMMSRTGLEVKSLNNETPLPATAEEIKKAYSAVSSELLDRVKANWTDETLKVEDEMYGQQWSRGKTLQVLAGHEIHHRGQMTVLMRQAGLKVPGFYGPAKEEWTQFGMEAPEV